MPCKALVVDDDPAILTSLEMVLNELGFDVVTANDGEAGLKSASDLSPDLVVTEAMMPCMTGEEVVRLLRQSIPSVPILMITASEVRSSDFPVLRKPFDLAQLEEAVGAQADRAR